MSLQYDGPGTIPAETVRVARAAFPQGAVAMGMRDLLGGGVRDHDLDRVYLLRGRPVEAPWRMALVTVLQLVSLGRAEVRKTVPVPRRADVQP